MDSFLKILEEKYDLFRVTKGEIVDLYHFPNDIYETFKLLLTKANNKYYKNCEGMGRNIHRVSRILLQKDENGKCYLAVVGNDDKTIIIIRSNDSNPEDYKEIVGTKVTEEDFKSALDYIQSAKLERYKIAKRFLREEPLEMKLCEEMTMDKLIEYYQYINEYLTSVIIFDEPENTVGPRERAYGQAPIRRNPVIPFEDREASLLSHNPVQKIECKGKKTGSKYYAYLYEREGNVLAIVEPVSGIEYQYNLVLGPIDIHDDVLVKMMIKAAIEAQEEIVMLDDAMIRKNHTTIESFDENLDVFLESDKRQGKFYYDVKNAKSVYGK